MTKFSDNLIALAHKKDLNLKTVAERAGLPTSTVTRIAKRGSTPRERTAEAIARVFGVPVEDMLNKQLLEPVPLYYSTRNELVPSPYTGNTNDDTPTQTTKLVPVYTFDKMIDFLTNQTPPEATEWTWPPQVGYSTANEYCAFYCGTDAMSPTIPMLALVYVTRPEPGEWDDRECCYANREAFDGEIVIATPDLDAKPVMRRYRKNDAGEEWLVADNPHYPGKPLNLFMLLGVVKGWFIRPPFDYESYQAGWDLDHADDLD